MTLKCKVKIVISDNVIKIMTFENTNNIIHVKKYTKVLFFNVNTVTFFGKKAFIALLI